ncbi:AlbA family DNA-binding domain-containing protein [Parathalassolituus penaei]|uniref:ATP-binding protein n=1 Tax=Parathalassolituus penaei TaxID=2997323 RepID=A0A9X3ITI2_9GAMM|nr:ATP-binding protein [Parathalassolituus penaei]MCY0965919.1 ATP-binding protein [Parathalassolituus penaei]
MTLIETLEDIRALRENREVECKLAQGRDGLGALPEDIWETYSAFANTDGGDIFLGLRELADETYELAGIHYPERVIAEFLEGLQEPGRVSCNIMCQSFCRVITLDGKNLVHIHVPAASLQQRPVYIGGNPLTGTYRRENSWDVRLDADSVRSWLAHHDDSACGC